MRQFGLVALGLMALSACQGFQAQGDALAVRAEAAVFEGTAEVGRVYSDIFQDAPFDSGPVSVLTEEHGELHSFQLTVCRARTQVCGDRAGYLQRAPDYYVVSGTHAGRTFYLSPGGDGYVKRNGQYLPLAWN